MYGIYNTSKKEFQFGICEPIKENAFKKLFKKLDTMLKNGGLKKDIFQVLHRMIVNSSVPIIQKQNAIIA